MRNELQVFSFWIRLWCNDRCHRFKQLLRFLQHHSNITDYWRNQLHLQWRRCLWRAVWRGNHGQVWPSQDYRHRCFHLHCRGHSAGCGVPVSTFPSTGTSRGYLMLTFQSCYDPCWSHRGWFLYRLAINEWCVASLAIPFSVELSNHPLF